MSTKRRKRDNPEQIVRKLRDAAEMLNAGMNHLPTTSSRNDQLRACFARGEHLAKVENNYEYAHAMFAECVKGSPGNLKFVEALVQNLRAFKPREKKSFFRISKGGSRTLAKAVHNRAWGEVVEVGVDVLKIDPWDVVALRAMAQASAAQHHNEVELVYLKQALDADPRNVAVNRHCAESLARMGQFDQAIACWHRIEGLKKRDQEAQRMISQLCEDKLRSAEGLRAAGIEKPTGKVVSIQGPTPEQATPQVAVSQSSETEDAKLANSNLVLSGKGSAALAPARGQREAAETELQLSQDASTEKSPSRKPLDALPGQLLAFKGLVEEPAPIRVPWLEMLLAIAVAGLTLQLSPNAASAVAQVFDIRQWSRTTWFVMNIVVLLLLFAIRFAPSALRSWRQKVRN